MHRDRARTAQRDVAVEGDPIELRPTAHFTRVRVGNEIVVRGARDGLNCAPVVLNADGELRALELVAEFAAAHLRVALGMQPKMNRVRRRRAQSTAGFVVLKTKHGEFVVGEEQAVDEINRTADRNGNADEDKHDQHRPPDSLLGLLLGCLVAHGMAPDSGGGGIASLTGGCADASS